jgi:hypothetical protein
MNNETKIQNEVRVLGRELSREQVAQVAGGTDPNVDTTGVAYDGAQGITTIARDSGVWGEGFKPHY